VPLVTGTPAPQSARRLSQLPAAIALGIALIAVPGIPLAANAALPQRDWSSEADTADGRLELSSANGVPVSIDLLDGWEVIDQGQSALFRKDRAVIAINVYDRMNRDPAAMAVRLMRANQLSGVSSALDGGIISASGRPGGLSGDTCVAVAANATGSCAFLADDDVVVAVLSLGDPDAPAVPLASLVDGISREADR